MGINIGLDVGAISLKLAALGKPEDRGTFESLCAARPEFRLAAPAGQPLVLSPSAASPAARSSPPTTSCGNSTKRFPRTAWKASASPGPARAPSPKF